MDTTQSLALGTLISTLGAMVAYIVKLNHKRIRSKCCDRDCTTSLDVESTTPPDNKLKINIPPN